MLSAMRVPSSSNASTWTIDVRLPGAQGAGVDEDLLAAWPGDPLDADVGVDERSRLARLRTGHVEEHAEHAEVDVAVRLEQQRADVQVQTLAARVAHLRPVQADLPEDVAVHRMGVRMSVSGVGHDDFVPQRWASRTTAENGLSPSTLGSRGSPSRRSLMMFRWIWLLPPAIAMIRPFR